MANMRLPPVPSGLAKAASGSSTSEHAPMISSTAEAAPRARASRHCRRRRWVAAGLVVGVAALGGWLASVQQDPFRQCDKQCRDAHGFYDRSITGERTGALGRHCACSRGGMPLGDKLPWRSHQAWNESFWCGDFTTQLVCAAAAEPVATDVESSRGPHTTTRAEAEAAGLTILHCGACAACSTMHDLDVLNSSKSYATVHVTRCATAYAKPTWLGGHRDVAKLRACLRDAGVAFSEDGSAWAEPEERPTCMDCWTDNIQCDSVACVSNPDCIRRFFDPSGTSFAGCIKCDEYNCGPNFIRCAGANRRSTGIVSDIARPGQQVCPVGFFSPPGLE